MNKRFETKIDKKDLKSPDKFQQELVKGFKWSTQHSKMLGAALIAFLVIGAGITGKTYLDEKSEADSQAKFYPLEKKLFEKKTTFATAAQAAAAPAKALADAKKKKAAADNSEKTADKTAEKVADKATGDFDKDYGPIATDVMSFIESSPKTKAAKMAALDLSDVQLEYKKLPAAQETLSKVQSESNDLLSGLVLSQLGTVQADQNDCSAAVGTWQKVLAKSAAKSLYPSVKLKQGLCYESMKDLDKAQKLYSEVKTDDKDSSAAKAAEKYLRLMPVTKKN